MLYKWDEDKSFLESEISAGNPKAFELSKQYWITQTVERLIQMKYYYLYVLHEDDLTLFRKMSSSFVNPEGCPIKSSVCKLGCLFI